MLINDIPPPSQCGGLALIAPCCPRVPMSSSDNDAAPPSPLIMLLISVCRILRIPTAAPHQPRWEQQREEPRAGVKSQSKPITAIPRGHSDMARSHLKTHA